MAQRQANPNVSITVEDMDQKPPPLGTVKLSEVFQKARFYRWTHRFENGDDNYVKSSFYETQSQLRAIEFHGQSLDSAAQIIEASIDGSINPYLELNGSTAGITPSMWTLRNRAEWISDIAGNIIAPHGIGEILGESSPPGLEGFVGARLLVDKTEAENWLRFVERPLVALEPLHRHPQSLPEEFHVSYCEAATWLANGTPIHRTALERKIHEALQLCEKIGEEIDEGTANCVLNRDYGNRVAEMQIWDARIEVAKNALNAAIVNGELRMLGMREDLSELEEVPNDVWMTGRRPAAHHDAFTVTGDGSFSEYVIASEAKAWRELRFAKSQLIEVFGRTDEVAQPRQRKPPGRPTIGGNAESVQAAFCQVCGIEWTAALGPADFQSAYDSTDSSWQKIADAVAESLAAESLSPITLRRRLGLAQ